MINVTKAKIIEIVKVAYDLSAPQGMGFVHFQEGGLTDEEAEAIINRCKNSPYYAVDMDYIKGRAVKLAVAKEGDKLFIPDSWYDHSEEQLQELLRRVLHTAIE